MFIHPPPTDRRINTRNGSENNSKLMTKERKDEKIKGTHGRWPNLADAILFGDGANFIDIG